MTAAIPEGYDHLIPHLVCDPCAEAIEFYKQAFGAIEEMRTSVPDGNKILHACIRIGGYRVFLCDDFPEFCQEGQAQSPQALGGSPVTLTRYTEDVDATVQRALDAGATVVMPVADQFWGDRYGVIRDPFGHTWAFAKHIKDLTPEEITEATKAMFAS